MICSECNIKHICKKFKKYNEFMCKYEVVYEDMPKESEYENLINDFFAELEETTPKKSKKKLNKKNKKFYKIGGE